MDTTTPAQSAPPPAATEDKTVAIISYITILGFIVAIIIHSGKKTRLGAYHLRQVLGLILTIFVVGMVLSVLGFILLFIPFMHLLMIPLDMFVGVAFFVLWLMGLIAALNGEMKPMPLVGEAFQKWFGTTFD